jgi:hypothetical protein
MAATGPAGDGQISSEFGFRPPAPLSLTDFFLVAELFGPVALAVRRAPTCSQTKIIARSEAYEVTRVISHKTHRLGPTNLGIYFPSC